MKWFRSLLLVALVLAVALSESALAADGKGKKPPRPPKRSAPKPKPPVKPPVKPPSRQAHAAKHPGKHPDKHVAKTPEKHPPDKTAKKPTPRVRPLLRFERIHRFALFNPRTREYRFEPRWWYSFVVYPTTVSSSAAYQADYGSVTPPASVPVTPPVIKSGQALPLAPAGSSLAALLDSMDVENNWLPGQKVDWQTGKKIADEGGSASNGGAFVAAVCARLKAPLPPPGVANFLPGRLYDWLVTEGKANGWVAVAEVEAQLLANQGWAVIAIWKDPAPAGERTVSGLAAIVRPEGKMAAADIPQRGPRIIVAGTANHKSIALKESFPAKAWKSEDLVYAAHRPR